MKSTLLTIALVAVVLPSAGSAQELRPALDASLATGLAESEWGINFGLGGGLSSHAVAFRTMGNLHLLGPEDGGYEWDLEPGGPVCREEQTRREVSDGNCSITRALLAVMTDASVLIPAFRGAIHLGGGYRAGDGSTFYGTAGYGFRPERSIAAFQARALLGSDLLLLQVVVSLPLYPAR